MAEVTSAPAMAEAAIARFESALQWGGHVELVQAGHDMRAALKAMLEPLPDDEREALADLLDEVHDECVTEGGCDFRGWVRGYRPGDEAKPSAHVDRILASWRSRRGATAAEGETTQEKRVVGLPGGPKVEYLVRGDGGAVGLSFRIRSSRPSDGLPAWEAIANLARYDSHWPTMSGKEEIHSTDCDVLEGGVCYGDYGGLLGDELLATLLKEGEPALWSRLEELWRDERKDRS